MMLGCGSEASAGTAAPTVKPYMFKMTEIEGFRYRVMVSRVSILCQFLFTLYDTHFSHVFILYHFKVFLYITVKPLYNGPSD